METIEHDRIVIAALNLNPAELTLLCTRFQDEGISLSAPFFLSRGDEAVHRDSRGIDWRVNIKTLAEKLSTTSDEQRRALSRTIFRFSEQYPAPRPVDAMRKAGLV